MSMTRDEFRRAISMWGLAVCLLAAAAGWVFMRFGQAWSIGDLPVSKNVSLIVPAYVVTEVAMVPVGGKLVDKYGCKPVLAISALIYIMASMLCILSPSVEILILFRSIQGIGGGLMLALAYSAVAKFYEIDKRGKCNELMTAAFAIGSLFATAAGYFITDTFNWRAGFIVFSTLMLVGFLFAWFFMPKEVPDDQPIDIFGVVLAAAVFGAATLYTQLINDRFTLISWESLMIVLVIIVLQVLLFRRAYRHDGSGIPVRTKVFERKMLILMFMFSLCGLGLIQYFFKLYLTYYEFDIYKSSAMFLCLLAGGACTSMVGVRIVYRTGARPWIVVGSAIVTIALMVTSLIADRGVIWFGVSLFVFGVGLGCIVTEILCSMQATIPKESSGLHTSNLMAVRMVAIMAGNALIGSYINEVINRGKNHDAIDLSASNNIIDTFKDYIINGVKQVVTSLDEGFLTVAIILAMVTALLTVLAYTLGKDDVEALEAAKGDDSGTE